MSIGEWLTNATTQLQNAGIPTARLDALVLLEDVLRTSRALLLAHAERSLAPGQLARLNKFITQRQKHIPLAYIRGKAPFYGRDFYVSPAVLVPRPETEAIIAKLLEIAPTLPPNPRIVDVGTGSGCIGITAKLQLPPAQVTLLDIDRQALAIARKNAKEHAAPVTLRQSDLLESLASNADVLLANLPYVPQNYPLNQAAAHEPPLALFSGADGLQHYRRFWQQVGTLHHKPAHIILESMPSQHPMLRELADAQTYKTAHTDGFVQHFILA